MEQKQFETIVIIFMILFFFITCIIYKASVAVVDYLRETPNISKKQFEIARNFQHAVLIALFTDVGVLVLWYFFNR